MSSHKSFVSHQVHQENSNSHTNSSDFVSESDICDSHISFFSSIDEIIEEARSGKMFILVDDENRENEGDFVILAEFITPEAINFMSTYGRGLICLAIDEYIAKKLQLDLQPRRNVSENYTAFTTSIEARFGVTTGISAQDRSHTIKVAIDTMTTFDDIVTPGHIFPIIANKMGVLARQGHTEASVDIAKLANMIPSAVMCEILSENGAAAKRHEIIAFATQHRMKIGTIESLIQYKKSLI